MNQIITIPHAVESHWQTLGPTRISPTAKRRLLTEARGQDKIGDIISWDNRSESVLLPVAVLGKETGGSQWGTLYQRGILRITQNKPNELPLLRQRNDDWQAMPCYTFSRPQIAKHIDQEQFQKAWEKLQEWPGTPGIHGKTVTLLWTKPSVSIQLPIERHLSHQSNNETNYPGSLILRSRIRDLPWTSVIKCDTSGFSPSSQPVTTLINQYLESQPWKYNASWETATIGSIADKFPLPCRNEDKSDFYYRQKGRRFGTANTWKELVAFYDPTGKKRIAALNTILQLLLHPAIRYAQSQQVSLLDLIEYLIRMPDSDCDLTWEELRKRAEHFAPHELHTTENYRWIPFIKHQFGFDPETTTDSELEQWLNNPSPEWSARKPYTEAISTWL